EACVPGLMDSMARSHFNFDSPKSGDADRASRREFLRHLAKFGSVVPASFLLDSLKAFPQTKSAAAKKSGARPASAAPFLFKDIAAEAGLAGALNVFGGVDRK